MKSSALEEQLNRLMARHRIHIREGIGESGVTVPHGSILASVPELWIDFGSDRFAGRKRSIVLEDNGTTLAFRARLRAPTEETGRGQIHATDRRGLRIPIAALDAKRLTLHLLVEITDVTFTRAPEDEDPLTLVVRKLIEKPLRCLLAEESEPRHGSDVRARVAGLLSHPVRKRKNAVQQELKYLRSVQRAGVGPTELLGRHIRALEECVKEIASTQAPTEIPEERIDREMELLSRLVWHRACRELRFASEEIAGVVNPSPGTGSAGLAAVEFRLHLDAPYQRPALRVSSWPSQSRRHGIPQCLGVGDTMLPELLLSGNLFSIVEMVINYVETNRLGTRRRPRPRRLELPAVLRDLF